MEKNIIKFQDEADLSDYLFYKFDEENDITIIADLDYARAFAEVYSDEFDEFDYYSVGIHSDVNEYYISKIGADLFCIEPCSNSKGYLVLECKNVVMLRDVMNDDLLMAIKNCDEFIEVAVEEASPCDDCECCCCDCEMDEAADMEAKNAIDDLIKVIALFHSRY